MDSIDATKILIDRIEKLEPGNVTEIVGFILMNEAREDLIRMVHFPDMVIEEKVQEAKLHLANRRPLITRSRSPSSPFSIATNPCWNHHFQTSLGYNDSSSEDYNSWLSCTPNLSVKTCHYFNKGFCKHGSKCRYIHNGGSGSIHSPRSLPDMSCFSSEKLEAEITELLKSRKGNPVSIASLPMMYQDKYGRSLQAEGYLTESQRHGRAGYSLTKLLARLKSVCLFERPHGQHFVILAEDAAKYSGLDNHSERKDPGPIVPGSRQIYLTFPADSTFTEEDVSTHFSSFGLVEDVRIPCQQERMFGFVTFLCPKTVKKVLNQGNPHFVCGARVLVKPYRDKSKLADRNYQGNYFDLEPDTHSMLRRYDAPRFLRQQLMEDHERALELETKHLSELNIVQKQFKMEELNAAEEEAKFVSDEHFNHWLDVFTNKDDKSRLAGGSYLDQESKQVIELPDSPFEAQLQKSISTVM